MLALSFPLSGAGKSDKARAPELRVVLEAGIPIAVVQGSNDPMGRPQEFADEFGDALPVYPCKGAHSFGAQPDDVVAAVRDWLGRAFPTK